MLTVNKVFLLKNQNGELLDKSGDWVLPSNSHTLYKTQYKDEALNKKVEYSVKDINLRIALLETDGDANNTLDLCDFAPAQEKLSIDGAPLTIAAVPDTGSNNHDKTASPLAEIPHTQSTADNRRHLRVHS